MRKEIWKVLKDLENEKTTTNEAYHLLCDLYNVMQAKPEKVFCDHCKKTKKNYEIIQK